MWSINLKRVVYAGSVSVVCGLVILGCGSVSPGPFPARLVGADGQLFTVEDLEAIADDSDLTTEEKRESYRALGIEDEVLIDALLGL